MINSSKGFALEVVKGRLTLFNLDDPKQSAVCVDFLSGTFSYRRKFGGGRSQAIAKAVGLKKGMNPSVVDATAGLGRDAFILASLGSRVHMIERDPMLAALLEDGLKRAKENPDVGRWVEKRLSFEFKDSIKALSMLPFKPDVIYLDPMFPEKKKSALVKKEMRLLQDLLGPDKDSRELFVKALEVAEKRVVVKRPSYAGFLADKEPVTSIKTTKNRFDVYIKNHGKKNN